jgi:hypothetical protein
MPESTTAITHDQYQRLKKTTNSLMAKRLSNDPADYDAEIEELTALVTELTDSFARTAP